MYVQMCTNSQQRLFLVRPLIRWVADVCIHALYLLVIVIAESFEKI